MPEYIPYSIRHNTTDKDLAWLLDYLEREMGWEIKYTKTNEKFYYQYIRSDKYLITLDPFWSVHMFKVRTKLSSDTIFHWFPKKLFFRTYRTLLPAIRDLYSK